MSESALPEVTETEFAILDVLWTRGESTSREIVEAIYQRHTQSLHATVNSLLDRLFDKGYVSQTRRGAIRLFSPTVDRERYVSSQLQRIANSHYGGSLTPMLLTLVERVRLDKQDRESIRKIIESMD